MSGMASVRFISLLRFKSVWNNQNIIQSLKTVSAAKYYRRAKRQLKPDKPFRVLSPAFDINSKVQTPDDKTVPKVILDVLTNKGQGTKHSSVGISENVWTIPNFLCVARMGMAPVVGYMVINAQYGPALGLFVVAGVTDLLDGWIARVVPGQSSVMGSFLDPMADKILVGALFISLTYMDLIPLALTGLIIARDAVLVAAGFYIRYQSLDPPRTLVRYFNASHPTAQLAPTFISKVNTGIQLGLVGVTLLSASNIIPYDMDSYLIVLWFCTATTTVASGLSYIFAKNTYKFLKTKPKPRWFSKDRRKGRIAPFLSRRFYTTSANNATGGKYAEKEGFENNDRIPKDDERIVESEILKAALNYVNTKGWTLESIESGAEDVYMSREISSIFEEYDLVKYFIASSNKDLENFLSSNQLNLQEALAYRLNKVVPFAPRFHEALAFTTRPENVTESMKLLMNLSDSIAHHAMRDISTDLTWYTKRLGIASIYVSSELCLVQDKSENFTDTFKFLDRRVKDFEAIRKGTSSLASIPLPDVMTAGFTTMMNILGRNVPR